MPIGVSWNRCVGVPKLGSGVYYLFRGMSGVRVRLVVHACTAPEAVFAHAFPQERDPITNWNQWLDRATNQASDHDIARRTNLTHPTIGRWRRNGRAPAEGVILIARAYKADPVDGLVSAGYLTESDLMNGGLRNAVRHAPTAYLTDELHERAVSGRFDGDFPELRRMFRSWQRGG